LNAATGDYTSNDWSFAIVTAGPLFFAPLLMIFFRNLPPLVLPLERSS